MAVVAACQAVCDCDLLQLSIGLIQLLLHLDERFIALLQNDVLMVGRIKKAAQLGDILESNDPSSHGAADHNGRGMDM
ncbi:hypothetical protein D3C73_1416340 [compost metagenome]